jgi:hypothetical protein
VTTPLIETPRWKSVYAGAEWVQLQLDARAKRKKQQPVRLSEFGIAVADLLGDLEFGIYHIQAEVLHPRVEWDAKHHISVVLRDSNFCTFDSNHLTRLVILCHDRHVRCEVRAAAPRYIELFFTRRKRTHGGDGIAIWHPTIEQAVETHRKYFPATPANPEPEKGAA